MCVDDISIFIAADHGGKIKWLTLFLMRPIRNLDFAVQHNR